MLNQVTPATQWVGWAEPELQLIDHDQTMHEQAPLTANATDHVIGGAAIRINTVFEMAYLGEPSQRTDFGSGVTTGYAIKTSADSTDR